MSDEHFMQEALKQARLAAQNSEVPVGAVIVHGNQIIARAHNQVELLKDPTAHAEMIAITQAANFLSNKWLAECSVYVTLEPCSMCAGALVLARVKRLCFGAPDPKAGACGSVVNILEPEVFNHAIEVTRGICLEECAGLLKDFFEERRVRISECN